MTDSKWTKGPWRAESTDPKTGLQRVIGDQTYVAKTSVADVYCGGMDEGKANARLIAAAPDLAEACEVAWKAMNEAPLNCDQNKPLAKDWLSELSHARRVITDALRKAKGEP